ncbi:uncharacterized protein LOC100644070 [Bombus terrestris]|uniref:Uncharacterized protein LOC100644070 n=1 Tax=Bombus terrestris TaxID=30195 RepID=A0A9B2JPX1_BOMTE|nr:uncharacterized protein LOC100644070 [Bombus terrestris]XP_012169012.2 uncharacterized protein LOC100644070 [Bombus terrestris]XP_048265879.1 uncharacterized protein LOC100644070 [Bombus terrestris]XP_048265880.1 uncharacterized protein LOC100644070 [Bombus terrestris]
MHCKIMDTFPTQRYETKIESFDTCMVDPANQQQEISETVSDQTSSQTIEIENQENHENSNLHQQQHDSEVQHQQDQPNQISHIQSNIQQSMTLTPIRIPAILDGEYFTVIRVEDSNITVQCVQCQRHLNGNLRSTGNFLSHIKRLHPFMVDKIKSKANQRKPAMIYIDLSAAKCQEIIRTRGGYRKCYKTDVWQPGNEEAYDQSNEWSESPVIRRRKIDEAECSDLLKISHNNSFVMEDEFDAIGRNIAAKLRSMKLDQRIIAEKLLNDILFEAQLGNLHKDSNIHV